MVRKAIVVDLCDKCLADTAGGEETEADVLMTFTLNGYEFAIDLCDNHVHGLSVHEMIQEARSVEQEKPTQQRQKRNKVECVICHKWYSSGSGIALHVKSAHQDEINKHKVIVKD